MTDDALDATTPAPKKAPKLYVIPAGTPATVCRASICAARIFFVTSETSGALLPLDPKCEGGLEPTATEPGAGIIHHILCPAARAFHRPKRPPAEAPPPAQRELGVGGRPAKCIVCGCERGKPCMTPFTDFSMAQQAEIELREGFRGAAEPPTKVACKWLSLDPPICDAPKCRARFDDLPTEQRLRAAQSIQAARAS